MGPNEPVVFRVEVVALSAGLKDKKWPTKLAGQPRVGEYVRDTGGTVNARIVGVVHVAFRDTEPRIQLQVTDDDAVKPSG